MWGWRCNRGLWLRGGCAEGSVLTISRPVIVEVPVDEDAHRGEADVQANHHVPARDTEGVESASGVEPGERLGPRGGARSGNERAERQRAQRGRQRNWRPSACRRQARRAAAGARRRAHLRKTHGVISSSSLERGGLRMMSLSAGLKPSAVAGGPSVTRLTQSSCTGIRPSGMPSSAYAGGRGGEERRRAVRVGR